VPQPRTPLRAVNAEPRVRLAQAQSPSFLRLHFIAAQELNEKSGELLCGATEAFAWEQRTQDRVLANSRVKFRR